MTGDRREVDFDGRPLRTMDGLDARVLARNLGGQQPYALAVRAPDRSEYTVQVNRLGEDRSGARLVRNAPDERTGWLNVFRASGGTLCPGSSLHNTPSAAIREEDAEVRDGELVGRNRVTLRAEFDDRRAES